MRCRYHCATPNLHLPFCLLNTFGAYELYADPNSGGRPVSNVGSHDTDSQELPTMADRFKKAFSNENVKVHFVGAWCVI